MLAAALLAPLALQLALAAPLSYPQNDLVKRDTYTGRATYYDVGLGACGLTNVASDYIVALNTDQYGSGYPGPECGKSITISYNGKTAVATIEDECPSCPYGALDLSEGLFSYFADTSVGVFTMTWWYNDGSGSTASSTSTSTTSYTPTSTYTPPTTTTTSTTTSTTPSSTYVPPTSSSTSIYIAPSSTSTVVSSTSAPVTSPTAFVSSAANTTVIIANSTMTLGPDSVVSNSTSVIGSSNSTGTPTSGGNLAALNKYVACLGRIVVAGAAE